MSEVLDVIIKATLGGIVVGMIFYLVDTLGPKSAAILSFAPVFTITGILLVSGEDYIR